MTNSVSADVVHTRALDLAFDEESLRASVQTRTVAASLSSDAPLRRFGELEILSHEPGAVVLKRAEGGLPLLIGHDDSGIPIGVVEQIRVDGGRLRGVLRFGTTPRSEEALQAVRDGSLRSTSVRYRVLGREPIFEDGRNVGYRVTSWELLEASLVAVPFDHTVGVGRSLSGVNSMPVNHEAAGNAGAAPEATARMLPAAEIADLCARHGVGDMTADLLRRECTLDQARAAVLDELVRRDTAAGGNLNVFSSRQMSTVDLRGDPESRLRDMSEALAARYGGPAPSDRARSYVAMTPIEMAREALELRGIRTTSMNAGQIYERSMGTTDLPTLLSATGNRMLLGAYALYTGGVRQIARKSSARDFRVKTMARLGEAPTLMKVNEHGEFKSGAMADSAETYKVETFGRIVGLTRQAIVNDDLGAFTDLTVRMGAAAYEFECAKLVELLTSNAGVGPTMSDAKALFHTDHGNLAGTGAAIDVTSLGVARAAMRLQKGLDGVTPIDARPKFLLVPAALETLAEQYLASLQPDSASNVNPFGGNLSLVVDPRLDAISNKRWYIAADPALVPGLEYSYLDGEEGPRLFSEEGFDVDGVRFKVRLDYGCGVLDFRGVYANPGPAGG